jgi:hypothetical protein
VSSENVIGVYTLLQERCVATSMSRASVFISEAKTRSLAGCLWSTSERIRHYSLKSTALAKSLSSWPVWYSTAVWHCLGRTPCEPSSTPLAQHVHEAATRCSGQQIVHTHTPRVEWRRNGAIYEAVPVVLDLNAEPYRWVEVCVCVCVCVRAGA